MEFVVGVTGASGSIYAVELVRALCAAEARVHLVLTPTAERVLPFETGVSVAELRQLAFRHYEASDLFAPLASSFAVRLDGMVVLPCSMKTLAAIANGYAADLLTRAADVMLKEQKKLILVPRETPLSLVHLRNLTAAAEAGALILPPMPAFYTQPQTVQAIVLQTVSRILDQLGLPPRDALRWQGPQTSHHGLA